VDVLVIDAANVMGARPDGWWRDRAGAARRLQEQVVSADLPYDEVVLVVEGAARGGSAPGETGGLCVVHAAGSGDDAIVEVVLERAAQGGVDEVTVVTADRGLRARVETAGARTTGPGWLLGRL
jgi:hypothetical protein